MLYCRAKPRMCRLPKNVPSMDFLQFSLNCSLSNPLFLLVICFVLYSCFDFSSLHSTFLPSPVLFVCPSPGLSLLCSPSLCVVSPSLITFSHTLHGFSPLASLSVCIFNPSPNLCIFLPLASASFSAFLSPFLFLPSLSLTAGVW